MKTSNQYAEEVVDKLIRDMDREWTEAESPIEAIRERWLKIVEDVVGAAIKDAFEDAAGGPP